MNYIYLGLSNLYLPALSAAMHQGLLKEAPPGMELQIPHFRHGCSDDDGRLYFAGEDADGSSIWVACVRAQPHVVSRAVMSLLAICGSDLTEFQVRPCLPENPQVTVICSFLNRFGLLGLERRLARRLALNRYNELQKISGSIPGRPDGAGN